MSKSKRMMVSLKDITLGQFKLLKKKLFAGGKSTSKELDDVDMVLPETEGVGEQVIVSFSLSSVAKSAAVICLVGLAAYFLVELREILFLLLVAFFLSTALVPSVQFLERYKINRGISVIGIYVLTILFLGFFVARLLPVLVVELVELAANLPVAINKFLEWDPTFVFIQPVVDSIQTWMRELDLTNVVTLISNSLEGFVAQLTNFGKDVFAFIGQVFNGLFNFLLVLVLAFFLTMEREAVIKFIVTLFPQPYENYIESKTKAMQIKIGYWLQGQLLLMIVIGVVTYFGLLILGIDNALTLATFAGLAELLPVIGPIIAFLVAVPVAANQSLWLVLFVGILFFVVQQLENNVFVPMIMKKAVGLSPIVVLVAMLIGNHFLGVIGLILSIPVATTIGLFVTDLLKRAEKQ